MRRIRAFLFATHTLDKPLTRQLTEGCTCCSDRGFMVIVGCMLSTVRWNPANGKLSGFACWGSLFASCLVVCCNSIVWLVSKLTLGLPVGWWLWLATVASINIGYLGFANDNNELVLRLSYVMAAFLFLGGTYSGLNASTWMFERLIWLASKVATHLLIGCYSCVDAMLQVCTSFSTRIR